MSNTGELSLSEQSPRAMVASRRARRPTIHDVAQRAGISAGTVSRVLNNRDRVSARTRARVLHAAVELGLKPRAAVRYRKVAVLRDPGRADRVESHAATLTAHLSFALSQREIGVLLPTEPQAELSSRFFDGVIVMTPGVELDPLVAELATRMPVVYLDRFPLEPTKYIVCSDHFGAGYMAARYLIERGRRSPGFIGPNSAPILEELKGFKRAFAEAELAIDDRQIAVFDARIWQASALTRLVHGRVDALYAPGSSFQAMECLHVLTYVMAKRVPQDIALIGGENECVSALLNPPLTTVEEPLREMAERAALMIDQLTAEEKPREQHVVLPARLVERNSVV